ncbi:MAG: sodium:solute symporter family protein [Saprospiraceae bacterium]|nr:sodium:solute symporter family protein [Saprospiraceae bacterium]
MQNIIITIFILGYIMFIYKTRKSSNFESYSVADRSIGFFLVFASMCANYIGPGMTMGLTNEGFNNGYFPFFLVGFYGLGKIFEGYVFAPIIRNKFTNSYTLGDIIGGPNSHNNKIVKFVAGIISFGLVVGFCVIMSKAGGDILNSFLGIDQFLGTVIVTTLVMSYSIFGGIKSSMQTDLLQFCMFVILLPLLIIVIIYSSKVNFSSFSTVSYDLTKTAFLKSNGIEVFGLIITWFFGEMLVPPTVQTILSSENSNTSKKALVYSGLFMLVWLLIMLTIGILGKASNISFSSNDKTLLELGKTFYPNGIFGLFAIAMVGVVMSTLDALINGASVIFAKDILGSTQNLEDKKILYFSRMAGLLIGVISILLAVYIPSIIGSLLFFYSIWVPSILAVTLFSIYFKKHYWQSALISMLSGVMVSIIWNLTPYKEQIPTIIIGIIISASFYLTTHLILKK